jgi:phage FluMu protein Com
MVYGIVKCPGCKKWNYPRSTYAKFHGAFDDYFRVKKYRVKKDLKDMSHAIVLKCKLSKDHEIKCPKCGEKSKLSEYKTRVVYSDNDMWRYTKNVQFAECCANCIYYEGDRHNGYCKIEDGSQTDETGLIEPTYVCDEFDPDREGSAVFD